MINNKIIFLSALFLLACLIPVSADYVDYENSMSASGSQTLSIRKETAGNYTWELESGGGTLTPQSDNTAVYQAPASNPNCSDNPAIALKKDGNVIDRIKIGINAYSGGGEAWQVSGPSLSGKLIETWEQNYYCHDPWQEADQGIDMYCQESWIYGCDGSRLKRKANTCKKGGVNGATCGSTAPTHVWFDGEFGSSWCTNDDAFWSECLSDHIFSNNLKSDTRSQSMKDGGCCPPVNTTPAGTRCIEDKECITGLCREDFDNNHETKYCTADNTSCTHDMTDYPDGNFTESWYCDSGEWKFVWGTPEPADGELEEDEGEGIGTLSTSTGTSGTVRYSGEPGQLWDDIMDFDITGGLNHSTNLTGLEPGKTYTYYLKFKDNATGQVTQDDYVVSFTVSSCPEDTMSIWTFDSRDGYTVYDDYGSTDGTLVIGYPSVTEDLSSTFTTGKLDEALTLDGYNESYLEFDGYDTLDPAEDITLSAWVYGNRYLEDDIILYHGGYGMMYDWSGSSIDDNEIMFTFQNQSEWIVCDSDFNPSAGQWYFFTATYDKSAGQCKFYVNGSLLKTTSTSSYDMRDGQLMRIGGWRSSSNPRNFSGKIDEVLLTESALNASKIEQLYNYSSAGISYCDSTKVRILEGTVNNLLEGNPIYVANGDTSPMLTVRTNINANCRYSTSNDQSFSSMAVFSNTGSTAHNISLSGLTGGQEYHYYVKCQDASNSSAVTNDYLINFIISESCVSSGDGSGGSLIVNSSGTVINDYTRVMSEIIVKGTKEFTVNSTSGFSAGDEILIIQMQNYTYGAGAYEFATISSIDSYTITVEDPIQKNYLSGRFRERFSRVTQIVSVPHYTDVTINDGASISCSNWNRFEGGILAFRAAGDVTAFGTGNLNCSSTGFSGGPAVHANGAADSSGYQGDGYVGNGITHVVSISRVNSGNAGGGGRHARNNAYIVGAGGGGGGHAEEGGTNDKTSNSIDGEIIVGGQGGLAAGNKTLSSMYMGGGGGSGSAERYLSGQESTSGRGGRGGGIIFVTASNLVNISAYSDGADGGDGTCDSVSYARSGGGGGGAGGTIYLAAESISINNVSAEGGDYGYGCSDGSTVTSPSSRYTGRPGSEGRVRIDYNTFEGLPDTRNSYTSGVGLCTSSEQPSYSDFESDENTTNLSDVDDITNVTNLSLCIGGQCIQFPNSSINSEGEDYDSNIEIGDCFVSVNTSSLDSTFNTTAYLVMNNSDGHCGNDRIYEKPGYHTNADEIRKEDDRCVDCTDIQRTNNFVTKFRVSHFTGYAIGSNTQLTIWDDYEGGYVDTGNSVTFYANYTNRTSGAHIGGANCTIWFDSNSTQVQMIEDSNRYNYTLSGGFSTNGQHIFYVNCSNATGGWNWLEANDTIQVGPPAVPEFSLLTLATGLMIILLGLIIIRKAKMN